MTPVLAERVRSHRDRLVTDLVRELEPTGHWTGHLSSSALSTAVATLALGEIDRRTGRADHARHVTAGLGWLARHANADGGFGDTPQSRSNLSTTALVWAAFGAGNATDPHPEPSRRCEAWIRDAAGSLDQLVPAIEARYGDDRTFSVPIVLTLALSGRLGPAGWSLVRALPFELASLPRAWFGALRMPVVSYALPALIALGQAIHHHAPSRNPLARLARNASASRTLRTLIELQPDNGGFLEATPLTAFVTMSLASMDLADHPVARKGAAFLRDSLRADGSWPIDTNLATWVTTLSIKALQHLPQALSPSHRDRLVAWLLGQQYRSVHPYTGAAPGGWAWTDLPGGVPDADDTAGALLALHALTATSRGDPRLLAAVEAGAVWLLDLQNRDGGIPTFCRGWGRLPFDRSAPDLTAHALRAWNAWLPRLSAKTAERIRRAAPRAIRFLHRSQNPDGSWLPLWFGNERAQDDGNPVYGTAQVLLGLAAAPVEAGNHVELARRGTDFLRRARHPEGGWGGEHGVPASIEETSLALHAQGLHADPRNDGDPVAMERGLEWLVTALDRDPVPAPSPIGLYFAKLWYSERLYPVIAAVDALDAGLRCFQGAR